MLLLSLLLPLLLLHLPCSPCIAARPPICVPVAGAVMHAPLSPENLRLETPCLAGRLLEWNCGPCSAAGAGAGAGASASASAGQKKEDDRRTGTHEARRRPSVARRPLKGEGESCPAAECKVAACDGRGRPTNDKELFRRYPHYVNVSYYSQLLSRTDNSS